MENVFSVLERAKRPSENEKWGKQLTKMAKLRKKAKMN